MRHRSASFGVALGLSLGLAAPIFGCGDKFLLASRGIRSLRGAMAAHPSSILIYRNPSSLMPAAEKEMRLQSTLILAGHKTNSVENTTALGEALKTGRYDLVLADVSDASVVKQGIESASAKTRLLPVVNADRKDRRAAEKEYGAIITVPSNSGRLLASIDDALEARAKATSPSR
jgi:hypothetical protein